MRLALFVCVGVLSALPCRAQSAGAAPPAPVLPLSERDAVARFLAGDPRVRALDARIDEIRAAQAERTLWPNPSATVSRESVSGARDTFVLGRQELPVTGRRRRLQDAGRLAVDAAVAEAAWERLQLESAVRDAYAALLLAQQREAVLRQAIDGLRALVGRLRAREDEGEGSTYDRMRGARALVDLEADRARAAGDRAAAQGRLAGHLGPGVIPASLLAADPLAVGAPPPPLPSLLEEALARRGDGRAASLVVERFEAERAAAARLRIPTPAVAGGLKRSDLGGAASAGFQASVELSLPLFNRGQAAAALAAAQQTRAAAEAESWRIRIEADVRAAADVERIHRERAARYQESAAAIAEPLAEIARVGYEEGELSMLELLDAERQAIDARLQAVELAAAARRAAIELDRVIGREIRP